MAAREVVESWEDIEETGVNILETGLVPSDPPSPEDCDIVRGVMNGPIIFQDDSYRSQYSSQEPTVKILKRPQKNMNGSKHSVVMNGDAKPRQPVKTLQQREQEYAEARLRILGEARSPEEQTNVPATDSVFAVDHEETEIARFEKFLDLEEDAKLLISPFVDVPVFEPARSQTPKRFL
ncbi:SUZ domain-containing protein 1 isoform X2 [Bacillus rossius redtenbacheri]|uniref:SUZ domain-containing protein 1 isoform X2 n=1 Tax=Bacillus rossius redtenbacheri TaxID=93214 RepID=UPI002FDCC5D4